MRRPFGFRSNQRKTPSFQAGVRRIVGMPAETRRAARAARVAEQEREAEEEAKSARPLWKRIVGIALAAVAFLLLMAVGWLAFRVWTVATELQAAQGIVSDVRSGDAGDSLGEQLDDIGAHARHAAAAAEDPVWGVAEAIPLAGDNLRAARLASEALDVLSNDVGAAALASLSGNADAPLAGVVEALSTAAPRLSELATEVAAAQDSDWLVGPVRSGIDQVDSVLALAEPVAQALPPLLGADGPRNYLLVFQNNAEVLGLGGSAASQSLVTVDNGALSITKQASSGDFTEGVPVDVEVDKSALALYSNYLVDHVNTTVSRPDFPTAAQLLRAFWQRDIDPGEIDGVISIDPLALARILEATGPISVAGVEITSENAVSTLLSDVYSWWDASTDVGAAASDAFFATTAREMFTQVAGGDFDLLTMYSAVDTSIANGDLLAWFSSDDDAALIEGRRVAGVLPRDNEDTTTVGVFFRDSSAAKIDYYMASAIDVTETCSADVHTFTTVSTLTLDISQADADALPAYVKSRTWGSEKFRTEVFVYGPPGTTVESIAVDGQNVRSLSSSAFDLDHPVAVFETYLTPGETASVTATFSGEGEFGPLEVRTTPMVQAPEVTKNSDCG